MLNCFFADSQTVPTPVITGNLSFCAGANTTLSTASVSGYTYCWQNTSASTTWQNVGTSGFTAGRSFYQSLAFNGNTPYVAYQDEANGSKTSVMKFNGTNWVNVGNPGFSAGVSDYHNLAFIGTTPYVAFRDGFDAKCTVMKFDGTNWVNVGNAQFTTGAAGWLKFAINGGVPYVAFQDESNNYAATVMKFNGTNWVNVGNPGFSLGSVNYLSLAFSGNTPYVAYADASNSLQKTSVMKFNGTSWVSVGNPQFTPGATRSQSLAFDGTTPYVAFMEDALNFKTSVMKFDGTNWVYVGNRGLSAGSSAHPSLAINNNTPYVAYQDDPNFYKTTVMKFNGASWVAVGGTGISSGFAMNQSLVFNGNTPYVAFADEPTNYKTTVMKYELGCVGTNNSIQINTPGTYIVTVTNSNGSATSSPVTVTGGSIPAVSCPGNLEVCSNTPVFALTGGSPAGGVYSGPGVNNNQFNAASAGTGIKNITYTYTDPSTGCSNSCSFTITVDVTAPVITPLSNNIVLPLNANGTRTVTLADVATIVDNCNPSPAYSISPLNFNCSTLGLQNITVTATDGTLGTILTPSAATFNNPFGLDFDAAGNLYIADQENNKIRKISASGIVSTLAGSGNAGYADGTGSAAVFNDPRGIAIDASGNVYTSDIINHRIRKITPSGVVTTFAGGAQGFANGTGTSAQFSSPRGLAFDAQGNLYVADAYNARIRKITPSGVVTTVAGTGSFSSVDGPVATASIYDPVDVAVDAAGSIYVAEASGNKIRKISTSGMVSTVAGDGTYGFNDGPGNTAKFSGPQALSVDGNGNIYVADFGTNRIRKINTSNVVSTIAISGYPSGVTIGSNGNLYMTDFGNYIKMITPTGVVTTLAGANQTGSQDGSIGVLPTGNQSVLQIQVTITGQSTPVFSTTQANVSVAATASCQAILANYISTASASSSCGGTVTISQTPAAGTVLSIGSTPVTLTATDASNNTATQTFTVTVIDNVAPVITPLSNSTIINLNANGTATINASTIASFIDCNASPASRISPSTFDCSNIGTQTVTVEATDGIFGAPDPSAAKFNSPIATAIDANGNIFVADRGNFKIRKITPGGVVSTFADGVSAPQGTAGSFSVLSDMAIDNNGNLFLTDAVGNKVKKITPAGIISTFVDGFSSPPGTEGRFSKLDAITVNSQGVVFVADNDVIKMISPAGVVTRLAGSTIGFADGTGTAAKFWGISGLASDADGNIYVADGANYRIRKVTASGVVTTLAGSANNGYLDGPAGNARFGFLHGIVLDNNNVIYVADGDSRRIRKLDGGIVSTIAGNGNTTSTDGNINTASFDLMTGIAFNPNGNLILCEVYTHKIRKADLFGNVTTIAGNGTADSTNGNISGITGNYSSLTIPVTIKDAAAPVISPVSNNISFALNANGTRAITLSEVASITDNCNNSPAVRISPSNFTCADIGNQTITVEATDGGFGTGPNPAAVSFTNPQTAVVDAAGNVYVAANNQIRKISVTGEVTTLAGSGVAATVDGTGLAASFNELHGLSIDAAGNLYTAEIWSRKVRKVSPAGVVTTVAGSGAMGSNDGPAASASFIWVYGVAVDPQGNIYVVDAGSYKIRKISTTGIVSTYAGTGAVGSIDGPANTATFNYPSSIAIDNAGNIYVGEQFKIRKITPGGMVSTFAGSNVAGNVPGIGTNARIARPMGMVFDAAGNLFATQEGEGRIIKITPAAEVLTFAGQYGETTINGVGTAATFRSPEGLGIDASGNLYVADWFLKNIRKITPAAVVTTFAGSGIAGSQNGTISGITGNYSSIQVPVVIKDVTPPVITPVSNNIVINLDATGNKTITAADIATVTDNCNPSPLIRINATAFNCSNIGTQNITVEATDGSFPTTPNPSNASFFDPYGIETDIAGNLYISDWGNQKIRKITAEGIVSTLAGSGTAGLTNGTGTNASFRDPRGVATDAQGNVYVGDVNNHCVRKITPSGVVSIFAGNGTAGYLDGVGTNARLSSPRGLAVDAQGNVYVCDNHNARIRKITPSGVVTTVAGNGVFASVDGIGTNASIYDAVDIDIDNNENLYFVDQSGNKIRKISPSGVVTTIAGDGTYGFNNGPASTARFANPVGLTVDDAGNIYVADHNNYMIRKITPDGVVSSLANITAPTGIALGVDGYLYTSDYTNRIKKISLSGIATLFAGDGSNGSQNGNVGGAGTGNFISVQIPLTVRDNTPPVIICPANITTPTNNIHPNQTGSATATDNCTAASSITISYTDNTAQGCNLQRTWKATDASGNFSTCVQSIAIPQMSVSLGQDMYVLYGALGYVGCKTITPVITGGVAPYTYVWTSTQASVNNSTAASISVCNTTEVAHTYTVTVTAANGCVATSTLQLTFINISCSNNNNNVKVTVCLRPQGNPNNCNTVCVSESAAQVLINNGSYYGKCLPNCEIPVQGKTVPVITSNNELPVPSKNKPAIQTLKAPIIFDVIVANNPTHHSFELRVNTPGREKISMRLFDMSGRTIELKQNVMPGKIINIGGGYISGTYFAEIVQGENRKIVKLVKQ